MAAGRARAPRAALVLLAAGEGRRVGHDTNKVLLPLSGRRVFTWAVRWATSLPQIDHVVLVIREGDQRTVQATLARELPGQAVTVVTGGSSRHESEWKALCSLRPLIEAGQTDVVVIHDAARPLASAALFHDVIEAADRFGGALPVTDQPALTRIQAGSPPVQERTVAVQTPQAFRAEPLLAAYTSAEAEGFVGTDTASCVERYTDLPVRCVGGDARNVKITFPEDLFLAERLLAKAHWDLSADATLGLLDVRRRRPPAGEGR
ncbi:2-C-methyl-D-erythritol 4-phosphate cytidylyltransferase [Nocardioides mesophilus]|uniref:2-C-methyl-D-erythritol 4-phosphate cytidylyltransferase n=1 Tax=Nocardioides mesophilus TaxID=433659 RepID=A0A7G9RGY5_9ACTN|nr:2-C-methyl-D-erythritol 4-phosphate cytidylyltransferase [Nocardioides mesophilus]